MKLRNLMAVGSITLGTLGAALAIKSFLPQRFAPGHWYEAEEPVPPLDTSKFPEVEVTFWRCGSVAIPEFVAVRGAFSPVPRIISHSAVLVRHPKATFLYDTGLCSDISAFVASRSLLFRKILGNFQFEQPLSSHLKRMGMESDLDFALLSHLHWDHVSGIPDIPGVLLRVNRVEYDAARLGLLEANGGLVRQLMGNNPIEFFDCAGPAYEGFRSSLDLFGDGSVVLVPLPGHTAGNTGMFINRANGPRIFLLGDAAWVSQNYLRPATMHPFMWSRVTSDDATARQTLIGLHHFALQHPEIMLVAMHDAEMQEKFLILEQAHITGAGMKQ